MSYILDALKKSEEKRGTLNVPVSRPAYAPENEYRKRRFGLSLMFIVAALMAGWFIAQWQQGPDRQDVQSTTPATAQATVPVIHAPVIQIKEEQSVFRPVTPASPVGEMNTVLISRDDAHLNATSNTAVQSLQELPMAVQDSIPAIHIEGHIYDVDPHARMVIINGKVRKEKHAVGSGMTLQEITKDGVVINYQGRLFHIGVFD